MFDVLSGLGDYALGLSQGFLPCLGDYLPAGKISVSDDGVALLLRPRDKFLLLSGKNLHPVLRLLQVIKGGTDTLRPRFDRTGDDGEAEPGQYEKDYAEYQRHPYQQAKIRSYERHFLLCDKTDHDCEKAGTLDKGRDDDGSHPVIRSHLRLTRTCLDGSLSYLGYAECCSKRRNGSTESRAYLSESRTGCRLK